MPDMVEISAEQVDELLAARAEAKGWTLEKTIGFYLLLGLAKEIADEENAKRIAEGKTQLDLDAMRVER